MCEELGNDEMMTAYVEEYGNVSTCSVASNHVGCEKREVAYIEKMASLSIASQSDHLKRLERMEGSSMKPELMKWLKKRKNILKQLIAQGEEL